MAVCKQNEQGDVIGKKQYLVKHYVTTPNDRAVGLLGV